MKKRFLLVLFLLILVTPVLAKTYSGSCYTGDKKNTAECAGACAATNGEHFYCRSCYTSDLKDTLFCENTCAATNGEHFYCGACSTTEYKNTLFCSGYDPSYNPPATFCIDECIEGQKTCSGNYYKTCGNYDDDTCLEWSSGVICSDGCSQGYCTQPDCDKDTNPFKIFTENNIPKWCRNLGQGYKWYSTQEINKACSSLDDIGKTNRVLNGENICTEELKWETCGPRTLCNKKLVIDKKSYWCRNINNQGFKWTSCTECGDSQACKTESVSYPSDSTARCQQYHFICQDNKWNKCDSANPSGISVGNYQCLKGGWKSPQDLVRPAPKKQSSKIIYYLKRFFRNQINLNQ